MYSHNCFYNPIYCNFATVVSAYGHANSRSRCKYNWPIAINSLLKLPLVY